MTIRIIFLCVFNCLFYLVLHGQNLIPNGDFSLNKYAYAKDHSAFEIVEGWSSVVGTPDIYCEKFGKLVSIPNNICGNERACLGNSYAGIILNSDSVNRNKEIIQCSLTNPLKKNTKYSFIMYYSLAENSGLMGDSINFLFSKGPLRNLKQIENHKPRFGSKMQTKVDGWVKIKFDFIAQGGEKFLTIGRAKMDFFVERLDSKVYQWVKPYNSGVYGTCYLFIDNIGLYESGTEHVHCECDTSSKEKLTGNTFSKVSKEKLTDNTLPETKKDSAEFLLLFDQGQFDFIKNDSILTDICNLLQTKKVYKIILSGMFSDEGHALNNNELAAKRAEQVSIQLSSCSPPYIQMEKNILNCSDVREKCRSVRVVIYWTG